MRQLNPFLLFLALFSPFLVFGQHEGTIRKDTLPSYPSHSEPTIPTDVEADLDNSFPTSGAAFGTLVPRKWFNWKTQLYDKTGLKIGASYQALYAYSSISGGSLSPLANPEGKPINDGFGGWFQFETQWKAFNKDKDWEGSINFAVDARHKLGGDVIPGELFFTSGTQWSVDAAHLPWDPYFAVLFYEQHFKYDKFWIRAGQIAPAAVLDFFRFKDPRVSFTSPALVFPLNSVPFTAPGLGMAFKWKPTKGKGVYIAGAFSDMNAVPGVFDWSTLFDYKEVFAGLEVGKNWVRSKTDFDHLHLLLFYGDQRSTTPAPFVTKEGWGFKVHGTKQWNNLVTFANYTYNTVQGGGFGLFTVANHSASIGVIKLNPFNLKGEVGGALIMGNPMDEWTGKINNILGPESARTEAQYGAEAYWRILTLKQLWITPGVQLHVNPTFNTSEDIMWAPFIKARVFI